ncbi:type II secretion system F family protein [Neorhodopirellula pilleata]|uniref:Bacterial type II secretion system protein F domain protein n=1 Tax=Neorhodopirellula pilleata TaxID=2714738 RepID=A0A5C5ZYZ8_9BACT|nr:type II secretion system F family protein [Neorhodopirellula pilleata]TWT92247.1 Bacterial type II secretion system protein F domain protein [Neorhodopirellula pilleata]
MTDKPTQLDDDALTMLLDEIVAMVRSGRTFVEGLVDLDQSGMGPIGRAAGWVRRRIEQGHSAADAIADLSRTHREPVRIAMDVMARTGSTEPIEEAARLIRDGDEQLRQSRLAAINPLLNVIVAATVAFFVLPFMITSFAQSEPIRDAFAPSVQQINQTFRQNFLLSVVATVIVVGGFAGGVYVWLIRSIHRSDPFRDHAIFCRWLALQLGLTETARTLETAARVVGPRFAESWKTVVERVRGGSIAASSLMMPAGTPDAVQTCVADWVGGSRDTESIQNDLWQLAVLYDQRSHRRRTWWIDVVPRWVSSVLMIAVIVWLVRTMVWPLLEILKEVTP